MCSWVCVTPTRLRFDPKSWQNFIWALGLFAYKHPARSLCCHIKRKRCFLEFLHVSTVDQYQIIVCSVLLGQTGQSCGVFRSSMCWFSSVEQLVQLHRISTFCMKKAHCFSCAHLGKHFTRSRLGTPKRWHLFVPPVPFILFPLLCWKVTADVPYLTYLILLL